MTLWSNLHLASPWALVLLVIAPLVMLLGRRVTRPAPPVLPTVGQLPRVPRSLRQSLLPMIPTLRWLTIVALIVALARPQLGIGRTQTSTEAVAIQIVMDRSGSMRYEMELDGQMLSRLDVVKRVLHDFLTGDKRGLDGRSSDLIGLVTFARYSETVCPLVRDPKAVSDLAGAAQPAAQQYEDGTAIGDGLSLAAARLHTAEQELRARNNAADSEQVQIKSKVMILLTDGEQNAGERSPEEAAKVAKDWGIRVYTIGIGAGSDAYQTVQDPLFGERRLRIRSTVDEKSLQAIADETGGKYFRAQDGEALRSIYAEIDRLEKTSVKTIEFTDYAERFMPLAIAAAILLSAEVVLSSTWLRRTC